MSFSMHQYERSIERDTKDQLNDTLKELVRCEARITCLELTVEGREEHINELKREIASNRILINELNSALCNSRAEVDEYIHEIANMRCSIKRENIFQEEPCHQSE